MIRRLTVAALLGTSAFAFSTAPAHAYAACKADYACTTTYYSTISHTTVVGQIFVDCAGGRSSWGTMSGFVVVTNSACNAPD
ncbi:hypothetical protein ABIA35_006427 [Catenulispora sp. MAP12-49]|uniref:DUF6289 family protein n=1 Tax=unclassified Catenulispora TaxID=414885 RepID=UPI0035112A2E